MEKTEQEIQTVSPQPKPCAAWRAAIPNIVTCCNLVCGCMATTYALFFDYETALLLIILGAVFDFFDGLTARALGVSSPIGKELDSLADVVTFGVAPSAMLFAFFYYIKVPEQIIGPMDFLPFTAFLIAAFSAYRLAKFNLDTRQTNSFLGLPTPANALFWASLINGFGADLGEWPLALPFLLLLIVLSCWLLVCEMPMFALKFKTWKLCHENMLRYGFICFCAALFVITLFLGVEICSFVVMIVAYIFISLIAWLAPKNS